MTHIPPPVCYHTFSLVNQTTDERNGVEIVMPAFYLMLLDDEKETQMAKTKPSFAKPNVFRA